ncbi:hypothetical protein D9611_002478 [Ephemerocybe angulata]|uniref:Uncharacterized protein n=1 Tax=Ephemerocybe angulata TaxID=980116 RepID=A0A8H5C0Z9_9AGAR|nr:hypothetical protein D9611_002478 [Tulosesus angulatus]
MDPTTRFQQAVPYLLLPVSEPLSALHATRRRLHYSPCPDDPNVCAACGSCLHTGTTQYRVARSKSKKSRVAQTTCLACDHVRITPLALYSSTTTKTSVFHIPSAGPDARDGIASNAVASMQPPPLLPAARLDNPRDSSERPTASSSTLQTPRSGAAGKITQTRQKKKTGLQAMLARNREQEQERAKSQTKHEGGLSAFLDGL